MKEKSRAEVLELEGRLEKMERDLEKVYNVFNRLLIKIIDLYFPLLRNCLMTSAGGNFSLFSHVEKS